MKRGTIREERPDLLQYLVNEEDGELTCGSKKIILTKCPICNFQKEMTVENLVNRNYNCNNCISIKVKRPDLLKYFVNEEDSKLSYESNKKIEVKCPICNFKKMMIVQNLVNRGFGCSNKNCIKCKRSDDYKYKINQIINNMVVLEVVKKNNYKFYKLQCLKDSTIHSMGEDGLNRGSSCPVCIGKKVSIGINDIATTHPYLIKYLKNKNDGFKYSKGSNKKIKVICPICKSEKEMTICNLVNQGFSCSACGDGNSYPNKFVEYLVKQSNINFYTEKTFNWSNNKRYDIYIPSLNCIIENHGRQHYEKSGFTVIGGCTLEEEQKNDKLKRNLAKENGIENYFEINCSKSDLEWIKKSVIKSGLLELLRLKENDINWLECHKYAVKSKVVLASKLWNEGYSVSKICIQLSISKTYISQYLKQGKELNICDYTPEKSKRRSIQYENHNYYNAKYVYIDNKLFRSISEFSKYYGEHQSTLSNWLRERNKMPQKYIDLGLRYATEEDLNTYPLYEETEGNDVNSNITINNNII